MDIRRIGAELRTAIEAAGIVLVGPIKMRQEHDDELGPMLRAMFSMGGRETEIHSRMEDWPPVANTVRALQYVLAHPDMPRSEELHFRYKRLNESRGQDGVQPPEIVPL